jgi:putative pyruvate formate lyase activating enzyme
MRLTPEEKINRAYRLMSPCVLCPNACLAKRKDGEIGKCKVKDKLLVSTVGPHYGEERCLSGFNGSGTIFLSGCNLQCIFCQNYTISHLLEGTEASPNEIALAMLKLQDIGCHNINFVTPTHFTPHLMEAIFIAKQKGLQIPIVWNCGGYESVAVLKLLDGFVDIYMPDLKFSSNKIAAEFTNAKNYYTVAKKAIKEMHRQVGDLIINENGLATRGLLVRHLVMPNDIAGSYECLSFLYNEISPHTYVNIMAQYHPCYLAHKYNLINRRITSEEFYHAIAIAKKIGLYRGF